MKKYEILEHKADLRIKAFGDNKDSLFLNMMLGMGDFMSVELIKSEEKIQREIKINSLGLSTLLVDFLSEVLYQIQTNKEVYNNVKFKKFTDREIEAEIFGQKIERFGGDIKAVTYHDLDVKQKDDGTWEAIVLFDI